MGRPTKYNEQRPEQARFICERFGADDEELAKCLGISCATLYEWKKEHAEFLEAVQAGKAAFDNQKVEKAIRDAAIGYTYTEEIWDPRKGAIIRLKKYARPDPRAQALWQMNRQGWRSPGAGPDRQLPAGGQGQNTETPEGEEAAQMDRLGRELLEKRHGTTIHVDSREVTDDGDVKPAGPAGPGEGEP